MKKIKDPISALTHFIGFIISIVCTIIMVSQAAAFASTVHVVSLSVFGSALILLYGASSIYHTLNVSPKVSVILRRVDHMMIFVLIAGTYTPVCLLPLKGAWGWSILISVWAFTLFGIGLKAFWIDAPRWLSSLIYVIMGWLVLSAFAPLRKALPKGAISLLVSGGITYTLGAVIYALKRPKFNFKFFGFHELFHLFVMGGSAFHIVFMFKYILAY